MKKFSLLALAAAGLLLGACSEKDAVVNETDATNSYDLIPGKNSWLALGIALPDGGGSTRANEDLVDGLASEFEVKSAKLILFKGGTEATATYFGEYALTPTNTFALEDDDNVPEGNTLTYSKVTPSGTENPSEEGWYEYVEKEYKTSTDNTVDEGKTYYQKSANAIPYGEITSTSQRYVTSITNPNLGAEDKLWAYVILNYVDNNTGVNANGKTFPAFSKQVLTAIGIGTEAKGQGAIGSNGLVMTSVPIATGAGGTSEPASTTKITTLSEIQSNAIFETEAEAKKTTNPLTCCYVERAAVKVELKNSVTTLDGKDIAFAVTHWALGNVNNNASGYYNTRQFDSNWKNYFNEAAPTNTKYRMIGRTAFFTTGHTPNGFRTYFGEDVNFNGHTGLLYPTLVDNPEDPNNPYTTFNNSGDNILYTYENTIDQNSMIYENTTYVGIKATIGSGADFWVEKGQPKTKLDNATQIADRVKKNASATFDEAVGTINAAISADLSATSPSDPTVSTSTIIAAAGVAKNEIDEVSYTLGANVTLLSVNGTTGEQSYKYQITINNIKAKKSGSEVELNAEKQALVEDAVKALSDVATIINKDDRENATKFYKYTGGVSYYTMRIAHFGGYDINTSDINYTNGETPWSAPSEAYNNYDKIYPMDGQSIHAESINYGASRAAAWLGRWSIVRNNWYVLDIKKVEGLGSPVPEDYSGSGIGSTPDDNPGREYYIAAEVHILPWVKRYQSVNF